VGEEEREQAQDWCDMASPAWVYPRIRRWRIKEVLQPFELGFELTFKLLTAVELGYYNTKPNKNNIKP